MAGFSDGLDALTLQFGALPLQGLHTPDPLRPTRGDAGSATPPQGRGSAPAFWGRLRPWLPRARRRG
ncbi:hypothetical protein V5F53_06625 [Xanthobacter sp. V4C-4]|uniref:hypothetical protein n=1 Tax=Xanthobacter cornucopiae TaxID=3119924 RepID=UPI00372662AB